MPLFKPAPSKLIYIRCPAPKFTPFFCLFYNGEVLLTSKTTSKVEMSGYMVKVPFFVTKFKKIPCIKQFEYRLFRKNNAHADIFIAQTGRRHEAARAPVVPGLGAFYETFVILDTQNCYR